MESSANSLFLLLPTEIHLTVLGHCESFTHALALATTCTQLWSTWNTHRKAVLYLIGRNSIVAFDDALVAVRATDIAERQYQALALRASGVELSKDEQPPDNINVRKLEPQFSPPSIEEIARVFDLKHLVDYMLYVGHETKSLHIGCLQSTSSLSLPRTCDVSPLGDQDSQEPSPQVLDFKVCSSMYRFFMVSAVLSKTYWEPLFADDPRASRVRNALTGSLPFGMVENNPSQIQLDFQTRRLLEADISYICQWPCYNTERASPRQLDGVFGDLAEYLIEKGRKEAPDSPEPQESQESSSDRRDIRAASVVQLVMAIITCHEFFWCSAQQQLAGASHWAPRILTVHQTGISYKKIPAIFLGIHSVLDFYVPATFPELQRHHNIQLDVRQIGFGKDDVALRQVSLLRLYRTIYRRTTGHNNPDPGYTDLPFELGFFEYLLERNFGTKVLFTWGYGSSNYSNFMSQGMAFRSVEQFKNDIPGLLAKYR
ncbi:hypothetical protein TWF694_004434 [Orbilia ellipsospora]|uniref:F-box domain-containing protein n=1 Tax=Orbilia ellipsospora TaxID=2528407 RepID=A0AAV9WW36_9PEZI